MHGPRQLKSLTMKKFETSLSETLTNRKSLCIERDFTSDNEVLDNTPVVSDFEVKLFLDRGFPVSWYFQFPLRMLSSSSSIRIIFQDGYVR